MRRKILYRSVLSENDRVAATLRDQFHQHDVFCMNLVSSPGAGKTALLERTLGELPSSLSAAVLTGDLETENDARRLAGRGAPVRQITTGGVCHLDASMIRRHLENWDLASIDILFIENIGNLVCPSGFDLGEDTRVVVLSVTEGEDKPLKYPGIFHRSQLMVTNKVDLLPYVPFDLEAARQNALQVNPELELLETSCTSGEGIDGWMRWIQDTRDRCRAARAENVETP